MTQPLETLTTGQQASIRGYLGINSAGAATFAVSAYYSALDGANLRPAYQAAINAAAAANGRMINDYGAGAQQIWEKAGATGSVAAYFAERTLLVPACDSIEFDFRGASIAIKSPTGSARYPGTPVTDIGFGVYFNGGFLTLGGAIGNLIIRDVDCDGGFTGDNVGQANFNGYDKGFSAQDKVGCNNLLMDRVVLHGFGGEIMYDNSFRDHFSRDCHFYNSGHSCWNPSGIGRLVAYNLQAGQARQPAEVLGGKGHTYIGGRFYKGGGAGSTFIGGPDPAFGATYATPVRQTTAPPPYIVFVNTRFEDFASGFIYLGSYIRGSLISTDAAFFLSSGFASNGTFQDVDLDIQAIADRKSAYNAVTVGGPATNDGSQPHNVNLRIHCSRTKLAESVGGYLTGLALSGWQDPDCTFVIDGYGQAAYTAAGVAGSVVPRISARDFVQYGNPDYVYFAASQTHTPIGKNTNLFATAAGVFTFTISNGAGYSFTEGHRARYTFSDNFSGTAFVRFPRSGSGMVLAADRFLRGTNDFLELQYSGGTWREAEFSGTPNPVTTQTGVAYTATFNDMDSTVRFTNAAAVGFTIPPNSTTAFPIGAEIEAEQAGAGAVSFVAGAGVTFESYLADYILAGQYASAKIRKVATDTWIIRGGL